MGKKKLVVLVSGNGSNLQAIIDSCKNHCIQAEVAGVISNQPGVYALERARQAYIPAVVIDHKNFQNRESFEQTMIDQIDQWQPDFVVMAGFMRVLTPLFTSYFSNRLLNIHPSILPAYKGLHTHQRVIASGERTHGCSIHVVNNELDGGTVLAQGLFNTRPHDTPDSLAKKLHKIEHVLYPRVLTWLCSGQMQLQDPYPLMGGAPLKQPIRYWFDSV